METRDDKLICPLCDIQCNYDHIINDHKEFWDIKFPVDSLPDNADDFNTRFGILGIYIKNVG